MKRLTDELRAIVGDGRVLDNELWRAIYARDASYFNIMPVAVVRPDTPEQVRRLLDAASRHGVSLTFRTGGTSLSGQTVNSGIICELRTAWHRYDIRDNGRRIWFEPGLTASQVNAFLKPHHTHIGPDPASSSAAMMGGILSNNSSGMSAGVDHNSYHTLASLEFILANGHRYDSASAADRRRFASDERELCGGLLDIRRTILADESLRKRIVEKYKIKNVTGYAMNAFVDYDDPMDIFIHAVIGSEGTLAFIVAGELNTLPLLSTYSSAMLYFPDVTTAAATAAQLGESGALAVEMMDYASLVSYLGANADLPKGSTAMLVDYGASSPEEMADIVGRLTPKLKRLRGLSRMDPFTQTVAERAKLWKIRDGIFPCVAGARATGATVILEDVAAPVGRLDRLVEGVQRLFKTHGYEGAIFGHARDGNIHPLVTSPMDNPRDSDKFRRFMEDLVTHVLSLDGSLKAEHGTGRAVAPFVEREWGPEIYSLMKRLKNIADPGGLLNPGVMINSDPDSFMGPVKRLNEFGDSLGYAHADTCMECGYCEHVCPTRDITLTPRQRLQGLRVINAEKSPGLRKRLTDQYRYVGEQTCCTDSSCQMPCPMGINTAIVTDRERDRSNSTLYKKSLTIGAEHYGAVELSVRGMLKAAVAAEKVISPYPLIWATGFLHRICSQVPHWSKYFPMPSDIHYRESESPDWIYFPACVTRIFGASTLGKDDQITVILRLAERAGLDVAVPRRIHGLCCSQIWEHKGDPEGQSATANATVESFWEMTDGGRIPLMCDTTSCTHTMLTSMRHALTEENARRLDSMRIVDLTQWLDETLMPRLAVTRRKRRVLLHPTCAAQILGLDSVMESVARKCADELVVPVDTHCCGAAGDRGFIYPEVARSATADERREAVAGGDCDGCYSLARTCEMSMMSTIGLPYESIVYLVDETTQP